MKKTRLIQLFEILLIAGLSVGGLLKAKADTIAFSPISLSLISGEPAGNDGLFFTPTTPSLSLHSVM